MTVRTVKLELEARLVATGSGLFSRPSGKVERKTYGDGTERLEVSIRNLKVPDGTDAVVMADGIEIARIVTRGGSGRFDESSRDAGAIPGLASGQTIEVSIGGETVLRGELYVD